MTTTSSTQPSTSTLKVGDLAVITKGCSARGITKGSTVAIKAVEALGADHSHMVKVVFTVLRGQKTFVFYARHINRLSDDVVGMNDGNPLHRIEMRQA